MIKLSPSLRHASASLLFCTLFALQAQSQSVPSTASGAGSGSGVGSGSGGVGSTAAPDMLSYTLSASDSVIFGYNGVNGASDSVNISGTAQYVSGSERHPTSFIYSGGYLFGNSGQPSSSFQTFGISQVLTTRKWTFLASDVVSYLPSTPRFGVAGVPGVGDIGTAPIVAGQETGDALLTNYGQRITNSINGSADYRLTSRTSVDAFGGYTVQRFLGSQGIDSNLFNAGAQVDHRLTQATLIGVGYTFLNSTYPSLSGYGFRSNALVGVYQHTFGPRLSMQASAGPQWTSGTNTALIPSRLGVTASVGLIYVAGLNNYALNYSRGTSTGSGVLLGTTSDYVSLSGQRRFSEEWSGGVFLGYGHAVSLSNAPALYSSTNSFSVGAQASRRLGQYWSAYGSYALQYQAASQLLATTNAFNGTAHVISFGVTYAPRPIHLGRR